MVLRHIVIFIDSDLAIGTTTGRYNTRGRNRGAPRTRWSFASLSQRLNLELAHVRAHKGDPWNELADVAAKYVDNNNYALRHRL